MLSDVFVSGELTVQAPRALVYDKVRDARFFASCVDGVSELVEPAPDTYAAVFETKVAYMKFKFKVTVQVTRAEPPREIEAKVEGTPLGIVGRLSASALTRLTELGDQTKIDYEVEAALTGKLGSLGQPVLRSKAKEMERQFAARLGRPSPRRRQPRHDRRARTRVCRDRVLVIGSGAAGMYAAIEAARRGAQVLLVDRSLIGRGGATVMAQRRSRSRSAKRSRTIRAIITPTPSRPAAGCATRRWPSCFARMRRTASASSTPGASAGRARTVNHRDHRAGPRPAALRLCRFHQYRAGGVKTLRVHWRGTPRSAKPATCASSIL